MMHADRMHAPLWRTLVRIVYKGLVIIGYLIIIRQHTDKEEFERRPKCIHHLDRCSQGM